MSLAYGQQVGALSNSNQKVSPANSTHALLDTALERLLFLVKGSEETVSRIGRSNPVQIGFGAANQAPAPSNPSALQKIEAIHELLAQIENNLSTIRESLG